MSRRSRSSGEIDLNGSVLPVGNLAAKAQAADEEGLTILGPAWVEEVPTRAAVVVATVVEGLQHLGRAAGRAEPRYRKASSRHQHRVASSAAVGVS